MRETYFVVITNQEEGGANIPPSLFTNWDQAVDYKCQLNDKYNIQAWVFECAVEKENEENI